MPCLLLYLPSSLSSTIPSMPIQHLSKMGTGIAFSLWMFNSLSENGWPWRGEGECLAACAPPHTHRRQRHGMTGGEQGNWAIACNPHPGGATWQSKNTPCSWWDYSLTFCALTMRSRAWKGEKEGACVPLTLPCPGRLLKPSFLFAPSLLFFSPHSNTQKHLHALLPTGFHSFSKLQKAVERRAALPHPSRNRWRHAAAWHGMPCMASAWEEAYEPCYCKEEQNFSLLLWSRKEDCVFLDPSQERRRQKKSNFLCLLPGQAF